MDLRYTKKVAVEFFVWDADAEDDVAGGPAIIRQEADFNSAVSGL